MLQSEHGQHLPDTNRLSSLAATILLAYALSRWIDLPVRDLSLQLPGFFLSFQINIKTAVAFLAAGLTASGADWLLRDHPALKGKNTLEHWILPGLTALVLGIPLFQLPMGTLWWAVFAIGGTLLILVLTAEYIVVDPTDTRHGPAVAGLTAVSFALYLILAIVLRSAGVRLFFILPALAATGALVSLRTLHLQLHGQWKFLEAGMTALVIAQVAAALHYWPLSPVAFGLAVLGPAYALTNFISGLAEGEPARQAAMQPGFVLLILWGVAAWIR